MSKEKMEMNQRKNFCPSSEAPTLRWFQSTGAGELVKKLGAGAGLTKK